MLPAPHELFPLSLDLTADEAEQQETLREVEALARRFQVSLRPTQGLDTCDALERAAQDFDAAGWQHAYSDGRWRAAPR